MNFLPVNKDDLNIRGIDSLDFILISGDAYVDHPTFGHALIARLFEAQGFSVGIIPQPVSDSDYMALGVPKLAFLVASGVVDSMVNNYTVALKKRKEDDYSENGIAGRRPDRATTVYCKALKRLFPDTPLIAGGIEPSLRRLSHYDYHSDSVMQSILMDAPADLIIYGMGENPVLDLAKAAKKGIPLNKAKDIRGTAYLTTLAEAKDSVKKVIEGQAGAEYINISSHERVKSDKKIYCKAFMQAYENTDPFNSKGIIQKQDYEHYVVVNPPSLPLTISQMDYVYSLEYMRKPHPMYKHIPAIEEVKFSITAHRGCFGNCSFCALTYHQGRHIQKRSEDSIITEVEKISADEDFKGYIHDIGGPSANFHIDSCEKSSVSGKCAGKECAGSALCNNLKVDHSDYLNVLRRARNIKGVKKVFVRSGLRFDYLIADKNKEFFNELVKHHISGQLKVAPEHVNAETLKLMNKPPHSVYERFSDEFKRLNQKHGKNQFLVPYFISSHPGCTLENAVELLEYLLKINYMPLQVQDFYPTPSTLSTTMYYTGLDPRTLKEVFVAKTSEDKAMQRALLQYRNPKNKHLIENALKLTGRQDLLVRLGFVKSNKNQPKSARKFDKK